MRRPAMSVIGLVLVAVVMAMTPGASAAGADTTAPVASLDEVPEWVDGGVPAVAQLSVPLAWSATDVAGDGQEASGVASYDVAWRQTDRVGGSATFADGELAQGAATSGTLGLWWYPPADARVVCFRVRATDAAGNVSEWTPERCSRVDTFTPDPYRTQYPISFRTRVGSPLVDVDYRPGVDQGSINVPVLAWEYKVRRYSQSGPLGDWSEPQRTAGPVRTDVLHAGERICFLARPVGRFDHAGPWTPAGRPICTTAPKDDSVIRFHGPVTVRHASRAQGGTARVVSGDASFTLRSTTTRNCISIRLYGQRATGGFMVVRNGRLMDRIGQFRRVGHWHSTPTYGLNVCGTGTFLLRHYGSPSLVDSVALVIARDLGHDYEQPDKVPAAELGARPGDR